MVRKAHRLVQEIKSHIKSLPCLDIPSNNSFEIVQINAFKIEFGIIILQKVIMD